MILSIVMLCLCAIGGIGVYCYSRFKPKLKKETVTTNQKSANEFVNVKDIRDKYLYTQDGSVICFVRINPISIDLYSKSEKRTLMKILTAELSSVQYPFKFLAVSRPVDISPLIGELSTLSVHADSVQKELLKQELTVMNDYAGNGEVVERQFYLSVWVKYEEGCEKELLSHAKELSAVFSNGGVSCEIIREDEIIRLIGLINNPSYAHSEDTDYNDETPII